MPRGRRGGVSEKKRDTLTYNEIIEVLLRLKDFKDISVASKLLNRVKILHNTGCWVIAEDWSRYTLFNEERAHRLSYKLFIGDIIDNVLHKCDRKGCINYEHLFQGTTSDNLHDWRIKKESYRISRQEELLMARVNSPNGRVASDPNKEIKSWREMAGDSGVRKRVG